eukprot:361947-Chlamydomonas_euryale.AAC.12
MAWLRATAEYCSPASSRASCWSRCLLGRGLSRGAPHTRGRWRLRRTQKPQALWRPALRVLSRPDQAAPSHVLHAAFIQLDPSTRLQACAGAYYCISRPTICGRSSARHTPS